MTEALRQSGEKEGSRELNFPTEPEKSRSGRRLGDFSLEAYACG